MVGSKMVLFEDRLWAVFIPTFPVGLDLVLFPYPTHFNPEDRGSIYLQIVYKTTRCHSTEDDNWPYTLNISNMLVVQNLINYI